MKDRLFSGSDVEEALAAAAASLGLPRAELRYVVLDAGGAGGRGLKPTPASIAVLLQQPATAGSEPGARSERHEPAAPLPTPPDALDVHAAVRAVVRAVADAAGGSVECEIGNSESALLVQLLGEGCTFFHGADGKGEPLRALEHLLQRMYGEALRPRVLRLRSEGFRERRDLALAEDARRKATEVRADGRPLTLEPMNAYERRIVHVALQDEPGITTYSVGEGAGRRVTIAPADAENGGAG